MTITTGPAPRRPSRLAELVRHLSSQPSAGQVGFLRRDAATARRALLIASFTKIDVGRMDAAVKAGADALELRVSASEDVRALDEALAGITAPVGLEVTFGLDASLADRVARAGIDWIRLPLETSIEALEWEKPARILTLSDDLDLRLIAAVSTLQVDAVLVDWSIGDGPATIGSGLRLRAIADLVKKPLLLHIDSQLAPAVAAASDHLGADGLLVRADAAGAADRLTALSAALQRPSTAG